MPPRSDRQSTGSPTTTTTTTTTITLKNLLKSSDILLKPPQPLSSNPIDLLQRLKACSKSLPKEWKRQTPEWCTEDELEQIGDNDPNIDEERKKRRRDELIFVVGKRCFALIKSIQSILEKEFWPKDLLNEGAGSSNALEPKDCTLHPNSDLNLHQFSRRQRKNKKRRKKIRKSSASLSSISSPTNVTSPQSYKHHHSHRCNHTPRSHHHYHHHEHYISNSQSRRRNSHSHSHPHSHSHYSSTIDAQFQIPKYFKSKRRPSADFLKSLPNSVLLGTADLRLIRLMLSHTTFSYLLPLASHYSESLPTILPKTAESLSQTLESLLRILKTSAPPVPAAGPSSRTPTPPTTITQSLLSSHLIPIFLSTLIIAYTPSIPSETYAPLRAEFMKALMSLSPGHAISTLVNVLKLLVQGSKEGVKENGWVRVWPKYPKDIINGLLTAQVRRPGGVRGLMENVLGETAKTDDVTSIEGQRLDHIFNVLIRIPRHVTPEIYYPWLLSELFAMIPLTSHSHLPVAYVNTACYCIQRLWASNRPLIGDWLKNKLHSPWYPKLPNTPLSDKERITVTTWEAIHRSLQNMRLLLLHNPTSPEFANFLVGSILPPLFSLHTFLNHDQGSNQFIQQQKSSKKSDNSLVEGVQSLLLSWGESVDEEAGVKGLWSIVEGGSGRGQENADMLDSRLFWEKEGDGVKLMVASTSNDLSGLDIALPTIGPGQTSEEEELARLLSQETSSPDAQLLCRLIESLDRPDIASEVILKSLDSWRIKISTELEPSIESLTNLQLTIQMMETLGSQLFTRPSQVLGFVERVLNDQVQSLDTKSTSNHLDEKKSFIVDVSGDNDELAGLDDDVAPDGKRGLIEVACQLLASLEGEGQLKDRAPILQPILSHLDILSNRSPSVSIRNAAREAQLLLSHDGTNEDSSMPMDPKQISRETYKQAMDLINDTNLPVKAHGLNMLKDLVFSPTFDRSFVPDILNIYLKQLDDPDSFIYLSAIKGLSSMVDALGKDVFRALVDKYLTENKSLLLKGKKLDFGDTIARILRIGEAIDQIVERTADAMSLYADELIPTLESIFPNTPLPTVVRSSALSILSTCARVSPYSILPWATQFAESTIDLIQVESVPSSAFRPQLEEKEEEDKKEDIPTWGQSKLVQLVDDDPLPEPSPAEHANEPPRPRIIDEEPTKAEDSKHPTLRRAALVLFNWLIRVLLFVKFVSYSEGENDNIKNMDDIQIRLPSSSPTEVKTRTTLIPSDGDSDEDDELSMEFMNRATTILGYIMKVDKDEVVRQHAESALKDLELLKNGGIEFNGQQYEHEGNGSHGGSKFLESLKSLKI